MKGRVTMKEGAGRVRVKSRKLYLFGQDEAAMSQRVRVRGLESDLHLAVRVRVRVRVRVTVDPG